MSLAGAACESTPLTPSHAKFLADAASRLLKTGRRGDMAFVRCLSGEIVEALCADRGFQVKGWDIRGVVDRSAVDDRLITADAAVELREDKGPPTLLLIDSARAGAGLDGIYSATREITEQELLDKAGIMASGALGRGPTKARPEFAREAAAVARRIYGRNGVSPWKAFDFYARCHEGGLPLGGRLVHLGLWPAETGQLPDLAVIETSKRLVQKLLIGGLQTTAGERIAGLRLDGADADQLQELAAFLYRSSGRPPVQAVAELLEKKRLWVGPLRLGDDSGRLQKMELVAWARTPGAKPYAWSGLTQGAEEGLDEFRLHDRASLEVRWTVEPELPPGSVEYVVSVEADGEELASRTSTHRKGQPQKVRFTAEDFDELDEHSRFEAQVVLKAVGTDFEARSEEFLLLHGGPEETDRVSSGTIVETLVEGAIHLESPEDFDRTAADPGCRQIDGRGGVVFRPQPKKTAYRVKVPPLLRKLEASWMEEPHRPKRWRVCVRADGAPVADPEVVEAGVDGLPENLLDRLVKASQKLAESCRRLGGLTGRIFSLKDAAADEYLKAWSAALEAGPPQLALACTVEVRSLSQRTIGLLVLPFHPLRTAWRTAYDLLARHARYEWKLPPKKIIELLQQLDGSQFPAMLPGLDPQDPFVFGDVLSSHAAAMVLQSDREPRTAIGRLAQCLSGESDQEASTVGAQTSKVLADEIDSYVRNHRKYLSHALRVHALRPGDGSVVAEALTQVHEGLVERARGAEEGGRADESETRQPLGFELSLASSEESEPLTGRFLSRLVERRRTGVGGLPSRYRWMLEPTPVEAAVSIPRLRWSRKPYAAGESGAPSSAVHLSLAFDTFRGQIEARPYEAAETERPHHAFGLILHPERRFVAKPHLHWTTTFPTTFKGERHPAAPVYTDRLVKIHQAVLHAVAAQAAGQTSLEGPKLQPTIRVDLTADDREALAKLHRWSDWVVTVDRHLAVEYFDSPRDEPQAYETYVIDCAPERDDLGSIQMITSTSDVEEVRGLLDEALGRLMLSSSRRNCEQLLDHLKSLSGRLAVQLTDPELKSGELIALALTHAECRAAAAGDPAWLPLSDGFFVPLDDVRDLAKPSPGESKLRADLLYVSAPPRGQGLRFQFVEVKFRQHRKSAQSPALIEQVQQQAAENARRWTEEFFCERATALEQAVKRSRLARVLRFYAEKGRRHRLEDGPYQKLCVEIDRMVRERETFSPAEIDRPHRGYIFCPEVAEAQPVPLADSELDEVQVHLFGPARLPDLMGRAKSAPAPSLAREASDSAAASAQPGSDHAPSDPPQPQNPPAGGGASLEPKSTSKTSSAGRDAAYSSEPPDQVPLLLGESVRGAEPVVWPLSIASNPHLLIVGLPGMGKTTCLINLCRQLQAAGVAPIVFSYHQDIDEKLSEVLPTLRLVDYDKFGYNPLRIDDPTPISHVDRAGTIRDVFAGVFPDLGEVQSDKIRNAVKESYIEVGWETGGRTAPPFQAFFHKLRDEQKPNAGLMARLRELDDYGLFCGEGDAPSLLAETQPTVVRLHTTQNEVVQRAFASFILYGLYQQMLRRGPQRRLTHAVVFDEAHRASKLKLIPTMAKECRKFGLSLILASQEAKDFNESLYSAVANYLVLRVAEADARALARNIAPSEAERSTADKLKQMERHQAMFVCEGRSKPIQVLLRAT